MNINSKFTPLEIFNNNEYQEVDRVRFDNFNELNVDFNDKILYGVDFDEKLNNLTSKLIDLFDESVSLENKIKESFKVIKHDIQKL